jgi:outer membrane immunogenic protein
VRRYLLTAALLTTLAAPAIADGLTPRSYGTAARVSGPFSIWTGCYLGGHAGGIWDSSDGWVVRTPGGAFVGQSLGAHDLGGWVGGAQVGCDYQFTGSRFVIGIQADYGWTDAKGSHASAREIGVAYHSDLQSLATVTGRFGHAWDRFLGYVKAGGAWSSADYSASTILVGTAYTSSDTRSGWTAGIGGEYAVSSNLSVFVEYNYFDFGTMDVRFAPRIAGLPAGFLDIEESASVLRAGVNLRFGK